MPAVGRKQTFLLKHVKPKGHILNDNDTGVDYLDHTVYAEALAETISHVKKPVTVGIFASWGSGKSFLVKQVCNILKRQQQQREGTATQLPRPQTKCKLCCATFTVLFVALLIAFLAVLAASPGLLRELTSTDNEDNQQETTANVEQNISQSHHNKTTKYVSTPTSTTSLFSTLTSTHIGQKRHRHRFPVVHTATNAITSNSFVYLVEIGSLAALILIFVVVCVVMCCSGSCFSPKFVGNMRLLSFAAFTKLPIKNSEKAILRIDEDVVMLQLDPTAVTNMDSNPSTRQKYIFVNFNAWEYAGSDNLWAGIATKLSDAVESEFGSMASRLFRVFDVERISRDVDDPGADDETFFAKFRSSTAQSDVRSILTDYGVLRLALPYREWKQQPPKKVPPGYKELQDWWRVEYYNFWGARNATRSLAQAGIALSAVDPATKLYAACNGEIRNGEREMKTYRSTAPTIDKEPLIENGDYFNDDAKDNQNKEIDFFQHFRKYPKKICKLPVLYWTILFIISSITFPLIVYLVAAQLNLNVIQGPRAVPVAVQVFAWLPGVAGATIVLLRFVWAMFHSQRSRIKSVLDGTKDNFAGTLGIMDKVKYEVHAITKLIHCAEFAHNKEYTVVITIDDLDRVPLEKIKSVLEAVSILLSDRSSPFVCLIAVDSRIAVKCIEEGMGPALLKANVNGHEYLKKIINLPFCLPEVKTDNKKRFIEGLIDESDITRSERRNFDTKANDRLQNRGSITDRGSSESLLSDVVDAPRSLLNQPITATKHHQQRLFNGSVVANGKTEMDGKQLAMKKGEQLTPSRNSADKIAICLCSKVSDKNTERLTGEEFLYKCRVFLQEDQLIHKHLQGNPRNIKRIFNILSLTAVIINSTEKQKQKQRVLRDSAETEPSRNNNFQSLSNLKANDDGTLPDFPCELLAEHITRWIVLTDQWPYRMSYILQAINDSDQRFAAGRISEDMSDDVDVFHIYQTLVQTEINEIVEVHKSLLSLDADPDIFYSFVKQLRLTKSKAKQLNLYTINLDHSLRQSIAHQRNLIDIQKSKEKSGHSDELMVIPEYKTEHEQHSASTGSSCASNRELDEAFALVLGNPCSSASGKNNLDPKGLKTTEL